MCKGKLLIFLGITAIITAIDISGCKSKRTSDADPREAYRIIDSPSAAYLKALDKQNTSAVFVLTKNYPQLKNLTNRVIQLKPLNQDLSIKFDDYLHKEYMGPIYILLPSYYTGIRASVILKCFPAYKAFTLKELSENYVLYYTDKKR